MLQTEKNLSVITKIILIYSIFFVGLKLFVIIQGAWLIPNLLLMVPFLVFATISGVMVKKEQYSWAFVIFAGLVIILVRIFETQLAQWVQQTLLTT